jgi:hypothetical protein
MVPPAPDARASGPIAAHSNRVSTGDGLRCRETGFPGRRKMRQYVPRTTDQRSKRPSGRARTPPIRGLSQPLQEFSGSTRLRGGAGRIRTPNQTVMSQRFRRRRTESFSVPVIAMSRPSSTRSSASSGSSMASSSRHFPRSCCRQGQARGGLALGCNLGLAASHAAVRPYRGRPCVLRP